MFEFVAICNFVIPFLAALVFFAAIYISHQVGYWKGQDDCYKAEHHKGLDNAESNN